MTFFPRRWNKERAKEKEEKGTFPFLMFFLYSLTFCGNERLLRWRQVIFQRSRTNSSFAQMALTSSFQFWSADVWLRHMISWSPTISRKWRTASLNQKENSIFTWPSCGWFLCNEHSPINMVLLKKQTLKPKPPTEFLSRHCRQTRRPHSVWDGISLFTSTWVTTNPHSNIYELQE